MMLICFVSHSGKTIPNGTDKHQLGTPENEGKFQKWPLLTDETWLLVSICWVLHITALFIYLFIYIDSLLTTFKPCFPNDYLNV